MGSVSFMENLGDEVERFLPKAVNAMTKKKNVIHL